MMNHVYASYMHATCVAQFSYSKKTPEMSGIRLYIIATE